MIIQLLFSQAMMIVQVCFFIQGIVLVHGCCLFRL